MIVKIQIHHEDTVLYEGYECEEDTRTTWCTLIDNVKSFFPKKKETKDDEKQPMSDNDTLVNEEEKPEKTNRWRTLINDVMAFIQEKIALKTDEKNLTDEKQESEKTERFTPSILVDKVKAFLNLKKDDEINHAYEKAKAERDFISLFNLGNNHLDKKELDEAIESYKQALKLKEDKGARFKLELAMMQKKKTQKKQEKKDTKKDQDIDEKQQDEIDTKKEDKE